MKITLIRHTSVDVPQGTVYGQTDVPLKESFPDEAAAVLANIPDRKFSAVYCSPLSRCVRLAAFCGHSDATLDDRLKEMNFGDWEMQRFEDITDPEIQTWYDDCINTRSKNGESFKDVYIRVADFLEEMKASGMDDVLVFAHGGILMSALIYSGQYQVNEIFDHQPPYGGMIEIEI